MIPEFMRIVANISRCLAVLFGIAAPLDIAFGANVEFARDVFPIFQRACFECHGEKLQKGGLRLDQKSATLFSGQDSVVIARGAAGKSELYRRITLPGEHEDIMPNRGEPLKKREIELIRDWINAGAPWPDGFRVPKHWAYVAPVKQPLPQVTAERWVRNELDRFVLARLERDELQPSPEASRETLIRRLSLDLIGIPPSPDEVDAFLSDKSADAYESLVNRLLKSDEFGVRWARPWLDYARYADSHGYQRDNFREIWAYRDWVVNALNADMPFDRFSIEQLAGDLIPNATQAQKIATGFNQNSPTNVEAGTEPEETRVNQVFDRVNTLATVWLGSTLECAQCHNHKYDPFSMKDYYGLFAFFNTTELEANRTNPNAPGSIKFQGTYMDLTDQGVEARKTEWKKSIATLKTKMKQFNRRFLRSDPKWEKEMLAKAAMVAKHHVLDIADVTVSAGSTYQRLNDKSLLFTGKVPDKEDYTLTVATDQPIVSGLKIEFLADKSLNGNGPARGNGERPNTVLNHFEIKGRPAPGGELGAVDIASVTADYSQPNWHVSQLLDDDLTTGWAIAGQFGKSHWFTAEFANPIAYEGGNEFQIKLIQQFGGGRQAGRVRISAITGDPKAGNISSEIIDIVKLPFNERSGQQIAALQKFRSESDPEFLKAKSDLADTEKQLKNLEAPKTLVMREQAKLRESFMLTRGVFSIHGEKVEPTVPAVLHPLRKKHFQFGEKTFERPNRLVMAQWLMDRENPITARATVNRFWQELFGHGIVTTPEDFGIKGDSPTHPALLDWLSVYFVDNNWSIKQTLKKIVMSATYRQSSKINEKLTEIDPQNALYARGPRFRMSAEMIRDNALGIAGLLSTGKGGPSIKPYQPDGVWTKVGGDAYKYVVSPGEKKYRRGIYVVRKRGAPYPSFVNFDANNRMACRVNRRRSNTPLQALTLMNDPVYIEAAMAFAKRILTEKPKASTEERIDHAVRIALTRSARTMETKVLRQLYHQQLKSARDDANSTTAFVGQFQIPATVDAAEFVAWYAVAAALLNLDETITKG